LGKVSHNPITYESVQFHNVSELEQSNKMPGLRLHRFPANVRCALSEKGKTKAIESNGCEIRFVTDAVNVQISLSSLGTNGKVLVFRGDFFHSSHTLQAGVIETISLEVPERFAEVSQDKLYSGAFASNVWRIFFERFSAVFYDIDAFGHEVRPPKESELPKLTLLAYGSSITQGAGTLSNYNGYVQQAARRLGVDAVNLGLSGACYCEKELADHIALRGDWDAAFFELGVNMRSIFSIEQFEQRAFYLLDQIINANPQKPIFLTTIYPNRATYFLNSSNALTDHEQRYNEALRKYATTHGNSNLYLIEGSQIMTDFTSLTSDLIHPSDFGHIQMGEQLAKFISPLLNRHET
jgi:lysophospholipase L1-like esterase